jgi:hypothetical protein
MGSQHAPDSGWNAAMPAAKALRSAAMASSTWWISSWSTIILLSILASA